MGDSRKKRILMGIPHPAAKGGIGVDAPLLVEYFVNHRDFGIRTFYYGSRKFGVAHESLLMKVIVTTYTYLDFLRHLIVFRPHIIHLNTAFGSYSLLRDFPFAVTALLFRLKLIFKIHGSLTEVIQSRNWKIRFLSRAFFCGARIVGVLTETERKEFLARYPVGKKIRLVKNIAPPVLFNGECRQYNFPDDCLYGLFVSRIDPRKGLSDLIEALPGIVESIPSFRLIVAGDGPSLEECRNLAEKIGVTQYIFWLGWVDAASLGELFSASRLFIFPTRYPEGMPMALIGAMQFRVPIITTKCRFANDFLTEGENYLAIAMANPADIMRKVIQLLNDSEMCERMRIANQKFVMKFGIESVGNEFVQLYSEMMSPNIQRQWVEDNKHQNTSEVS